MARRMTDSGQPEALPNPKPQSPQRNREAEMGATLATTPSKRPEKVVLRMTKAADAERAPERAALPDREIHALIRNESILPSGSIETNQVQPASLDLRLGSTAYRLQASFLPGDDATVVQRLKTLSMTRMDITKPSVLERGCVYLAPLVESLKLPPTTSGRANPKSTTGRLDIFTRLITDRGREFETVAAGYEGALYAEIVPRSFSVIVERGTRLNQVRLFQNRPTTPPMTGPEETSRRLSVNLLSTTPGAVIGYRAKKNTPLMDTRKIDHYDPLEFWDPIEEPRNGELILNPGDFYILGSRERVVVEADQSAEMMPFDASVGEFRIHYAGFFDPGFGCHVSGSPGTIAVLEVRAHDVPFVLQHGQVVGRIIYNRLMAKPDHLYGHGIGSHYHDQGIALSKQFKRDARG